MYFFSNFYFIIQVVYELKSYLHEAFRSHFKAAFSEWKFNKGRVQIANALLSCVLFQKNCTSFAQVVDQCLSNMNIFLQYQFLSQYGFVPQLVCISSSSIFRNMAWTAANYQSYLQCVSKKTPLKEMCDFLTLMILSLLLALALIKTKNCNRFAHW